MTLSMNIIFSFFKLRFEETIPVLETILSNYRFNVIFR